MIHQNGTCHSYHELLSVSYIATTLKIIAHMLSIKCLNFLDKSRRLIIQSQTKIIPSFSAIVNLIGSLAIALGSVCASRILHHDMVDRILHAPMMFFDTTPLGRVINRLSRDMDTVDFNVPMFLRQWFFTVVPLLSTVIIISYVTPIFLAAVVPLTVFYTIVMVRNINYIV